MINQTRAYKFRIYPTKDQQQKLNQTFGCVRFVWNQLVANFDSYSNCGPNRPMNEKILKDMEEYAWLNDVSSVALQQKRIDFDSTKKQYFNKNRKTKLGRMKFKKKGGKESYRLGDPSRFRLNDDSTIRLEKIGHVPVVIDRQIPDDVIYKSLTVSRTPTGKYFVSILVQINVDHKPLTGKMVGIDLGLKDLFILSDNQAVNNPKWFRESQTKLAKAQRRLSRKKKGSNRYNRQRLKVARIHERIANQRSYFLHNVTTSLVSNYDLICIEDLNVSGMLKNHKLAKSIQDAGWSEFVRQLDYKCNWYGKTLVKIDRWFPSTKLCSGCGYKNNDLTLSDRSWDCPSCNIVHNRDLNAATNILNEGYKLLTSVELTDYERGEEISLFGATHHLASSVKRLDKFIDLS